MKDKITLLEKNIFKIIDIFKNRKDDLLNYVKIISIYNNVDNINNNDNFIKLYKSFYKMGRAGLTVDYFNEYFKILNTRKYNKHTSLHNFLEALNGIKTRQFKNSLQFAFATKALHTANNKLPIYDSHIAKFFNLYPPDDRLLPINERIDNRERCYDKLINNYKKLLLMPVVIDLILKTRKELAKIIKDNKIELIHDLKILDFNIWAFGQVKNK
jgi:hypothetical protein